jgi:hypothetical protein
MQYPELSFGRRSCGATKVSSAQVPKRTRATSPGKSAAVKPPRVCSFPGPFIQSAWDW